MTQLVDTSPAAAVLGSAVQVAVSRLLRPDALVAARRSWRVTGSPRVFDADVSGLSDSGLPWLRELVEEFACGAQLLRIGAADIARLYGQGPPLRVARRLRAMGPGAVLLVCGPEVAVLICADPGADARADGPADVLIGLGVTGPSHVLGAALVRFGVPDDPIGWVRVAQALPGT